MPSENDLGALRTALEWADVEFTDGERPGVRLSSHGNQLDWSLLEQGAYGQPLAGGCGDPSLRGWSGSDRLAVGENPAVGSRVD